MTKTLHCKGCGRHTPHELDQGSMQCWCCGSYNYKATPALRRQLRKGTSRDTRSN